MFFGGLKDKRDVETPKGCPENIKTHWNLRHENVLRVCEFMYS